MKTDTQFPKTPITQHHESQRQSQVSGVSVFQVTFGTLDQRLQETRRDFAVARADRHQPASQRRDPHHFHVGFGVS